MKNAHWLILSSLAGAVGLAACSSSTTTTSGTASSATEATSSSTSGTAHTSSSNASSSNASSSNSSTSGGGSAVTTSSSASGTGGAGGASQSSTSGSSSSGSTCLGTELTVMNELDWCKVSVNGGTASNAATQTVCITSPGAIPLSATPVGGFVLATDMWHNTTGDSGSGDSGTVTGSDTSGTSATTVTIKSGETSACVWVCCPGQGGNPACTAITGCN